MKLLVLGGNGMAGHMIVKYFDQKPEWDVYYTTRDQKEKRGIYLNVLMQSSLEEVIEKIKPDVVVNAIGLLNDNANNNKTAAFHVNSLLPHQLTPLVESYGGKLVHISTDCVFSGEKGDYTENDYKDGTSVYAKTKALGEVISHHHLTIRTSIIGPELKKNGIGLLLWFMNQSGAIKGYKNMMWNGVTTLELAKAIETLLQNNVSGLYHLGGEEKISKYDLLRMMQDVFKKEDVSIHPDEEIVLDRTIRNTRTDYRYAVPSYKEMLLELKEWMDVP
ncbi:dTDP-4-dehydrorhamnose reductase family protein [Guptibacillus hwajinpoensis]|uniref:dTDP-4-dehydrorhamnose reductase n=1 Tax=Guptibacillus hwajinpoensis TaxID=208199 RepID=A0A0J6D0M2_9BACL|nr:SDR family oxidoreductase [Alkalihalobacillus macyae]KMM38868.1 dTDP-4-dehydrorhamnose reductase [Alkalihalobacillus macyae]